MGLWTRVIVTAVPVVLPKGGIMYMATSAKKHLTAFTRSRRAPGAGRIEVKNKFTEAAAKTRGERLRSKRNVIIKEEIERAGLRTGVYYRRSRSKYPPLAGKRYKLSSPKERVTEATPLV